MMLGVPFSLCPKNKVIWITYASLAALKSIKSSLQENMSINLTAKMCLNSVEGSRERRWKPYAKSQFSLCFFFVRC